VLSAILAVTICCAILLALPNVVQNPGVQSRIKGLLSATLPAGATTGRISLSWLPFPHLSISDVSIGTEEFRLLSPRIDVYPDWISPLTGEPYVERIVLEYPKINFLEYKETIGTRFTFSQLPDVVEIREGNVEVASGIFVPGLLFGDRPTIFSDCSLKLRLDRDNNSGNIVCSCIAPYARKLHLEARVGEDIKKFAAWVKLQHLNLNALFSHYLSDDPVPDASDINLFISVTSDLPGFYNGSVKADTPCITLPDPKKNIDISCGVLAMDVKVTPKGVKAMVRQFDLEDPSLNLTGNINVRFPVDKKEESQWDIDLKARDIDLSGVRKVVLHFFGKSVEAREVCDIVRGGRAASLTYRFSGSSSDFEFLDHMVITADVDRAPIYIPDPDLLLDEASGPIRIEGGVLYGHDLTARIGKSQGENGRLVLGLSDDLFQFELSLDLTADLNELQPVLEHLIDDSRVVAEIAKFRNVRGNASGSLRIGNDLRDFDVYVKVSDVEGRAFYDRLGWPVSLSGGRADIGPHSVSWSRVSGSAGRNRIDTCSGMIDWKGSTDLDISEFKGKIDSGQFLDYLNSFPVLSENISPVVTHIDGTLAVHGGKLHGPAFIPEKWRYSLNASPVSMSILSPLLPPGVRALSGTAVLTDEKFNLRRLRIDVAGDPMLLSGNLSHRFLRDWRGKLDFSGVFGQPVNRWVADNGWVAAGLSLFTPCYLLPSSLDFDSDSAHFKGKWVFDRGTSDERVLYVNRRQDRDGFALEKIRITAPGEGMSMTLNIPASGNGIDFSWQGTLSSQSLDRILENNTLLEGSIAGDFSMRLGHTGQDKPAGFRGSLDISGMNWPWGMAEPFQIRKLEVQGAGTSAGVKKLVLVLCEDILDITGTVEAVSEGMTYDVDLKSPEFHYASLLKVRGPGKDQADSSTFGIRDDGEVSTHNDAARANDQEVSKDIPDSQESTLISDTYQDIPDTIDAVAFNLKFYGTVRYAFDVYVDTLDFGSGREDGSKPVQIKATGLAGTMQVFPDQSIKTEITAGMVCGMNFCGSELMRPEKEKFSSYVLKTPKGRENTFEDIQSCLGLDSGMIQGPLRVNAAFDLTGDRITSGHVDIDAHDGNIRQFTMLSRIFSVVNLVDFFGKKGWREITNSGLAYSKAEFRSVIEDDILKIERAAVYGNGLNLFANGQADMAAGTLDVVVVLAPLKTVDAIVTNIPLVGKGFGQTCRS